MVKVNRHYYHWLHGTAVERRSLTGELSLSCARPAALTVIAAGTQTALGAWVQDIDLDYSVGPRDEIQAHLHRPGSRHCHQSPSDQILYYTSASVLL